MTENQETMLLNDIATIARSLEVIVRKMEPDDAEPSDYDLNAELKELNAERARRRQRMCQARNLSYPHIFGDDGVCVFCREETR